MRLANGRERERKQTRVAREKERESARERWRRGESNGQRGNQSLLLGVSRYNQVKKREKDYLYTAESKILRAAWEKVSNSGRRPIYIYLRALAQERKSGVAVCFRTGPGVRYTYTCTRVYTRCRRLRGWNVALSSSTILSLSLSFFLYSPLPPSSSSSSTVRSAWAAMAWFPFYIPRGREALFWLHPMPTHLHFKRNSL